MAKIDGKILLTKNDCYKTNQKMTPKGIVVHSTGVNNPNLKRYIAPDDGVIGQNEYGNDWNRSGLDVCVHGFIGKDKNGKVKFYQTLPWNICCWGVGSGSKGSYNYNPAYIQFEMCEDGLTDKAYCKKVYNKAVKVCAYLCKKYSISTSNIVSHKEAHDKGYGSAHIDPTNWWSKFGYTMDGFRADVKAQMNKKNGFIIGKKIWFTRPKKVYNSKGKRVKFENLKGRWKRICRADTDGYAILKKGKKVKLLDTTKTGKKVYGQFVHGYQILLKQNGKTSAEQ